jgi:hypothetical protein
MSNTLFTRESDSQSQARGCLHCYVTKKFDDYNHCQKSCCKELRNNGWQIHSIIHMLYIGMNFLSARLRTI